jgi:hypothetical protein
VALWHARRAKWGKNAAKDLPERQDRSKCVATVPLWPHLRRFAAITRTTVPYLAHSYGLKAHGRGTAPEGAYGGALSAALEGPSAAMTQKGQALIFTVLGLAPPSGAHEAGSAAGRSPRSRPHCARPQGADLARRAGRPPPCAHVRNPIDNACVFLLLSLPSMVPRDPTLVHLVVRRDPNPPAP